MTYNRAARCIWRDRMVVPALLVALMTLGACATLASITLPMCGVGGLSTNCFTGQLELEDITGSKKKRLRYAFGFVDATPKGWQTEAGDITDGASIPVIFQPITGGSYSPEYLPAAVIHDRYCDKDNKHRVRSWEMTHRMFLDALLATGVDRNKAGWMYFAVYHFGPRWTPVERDPGQICKGNLTPLCINVFPHMQSALKRSMKPAQQEGLSQLQRDYDIEPSGSGWRVYRRSLLNDSRAKAELDAVKPDIEKIIRQTASIDQMVRKLNALSDSISPAEGILLGTR